MGLSQNAGLRKRFVSKHNEALKVMPTIFSEHGYEVTVCDPPYANYQWIPDLSIYDDSPEINAYITNGYFTNKLQFQNEIEGNHRNFFCFSLMKCMPLLFQPSLYNNGMYHAQSLVQDPNQYIGQYMYNISVAEGISGGFMGAYSVLVNLPTMSIVTDEDVDTYLFLCNDITHNPMLLQTPDYVPAQTVDNEEYDAQHADRFVIDGIELQMTTGGQMNHYHANMAALIQLGEWFDFLRENGVYDQTRIIIASDHGYDVRQLEPLILDKDASSMLRKVENYYPLLMVKDFNAKGFATSNMFMTNADVPVLAMEGIIQEPVNPFTGKAIDSDEKYQHDQFITVSDWDVEDNHGNTFLPGQWATVKDDIWNRDNWSFVDEPTVLDEYSVP